MIYKRNCGKCNKELTYTKLYSLKQSEKKNTSCASCAKKQKYFVDNEILMDGKKRWVRICDNCNITKLIYTTQAGLEWSIKNKTKCKKCKTPEPVIYIRKCPACAVEIKTKNVFFYRKSEKNKSKCLSCSMKGRVFSNKAKQNMSKNHADFFGEKNPFFGKKHSDETKQLLRAKNSVKKNYTLEYLQSCSNRCRREKNPFFGKKHSDETKRKLRLVKIDYVKNKYFNGKIMVPNVNIKEVGYFTELEKTNGWNGIFFCKNGNKTQYNIKELGYFVDYYEPTLNIVVEYDEKRHYNVDGSLRKKDIDRQNEIIKYLHCRFFRYNERKNILYEVTNNHKL